MPQGFAIKGLSELQRTFLFLATETKREVKAATLDGAQQMVIDARSLAPEDSGKLKRGIHFELTNGGFGADLLNDVDYWAWIEFGTGGLVDVPTGWEELASQYRGTGKRKVNRAPHPFMVPAFQKNSEIYYQRVSDILDRLFK